MNESHDLSKGVGRKISKGEGGQQKKDQKISKKTENNTFKPLPRRGRQRKKRPKNSTFKPLSTISVPCMEIQGGHGPPLCRRSWISVGYIGMRCTAT